MLSKEEIEKAKERLNKKLEDEKILGMLAHIDKIVDENILNNISIETLLQYIDQLEQENNKLNKINDEMAKEIKKTDYSYYYCNSTKECTGEECKDCIKQYFEKKVEGK